MSKLRARVSVYVWPDGHPEMVQKVEVYLDDPFTQAQIIDASTAIQRGAYEACVQATTQLITSLVKDIPKSGMTVVPRDA